MGDGRLLEILAKRNPGWTYVGIELNNDQCIQARSRISLPNVIIINRSFEDIVPTFLDESVDQFIIILPDPPFIDQKNEEQWKPFYKSVYLKLKKQDSVWAIWLKSCFISLGFSVVCQQDGVPRQYSSRCIEQFRGDPERIRMVTLDLVKR